MKVLRGVTGFFMVAAWIHTTHSSCYIDLPKHKIVNGVVKQFCAHADKELEVGESYRTNDCFQCHCDKYRMQCCGVGHAAGVMVVQDCVQKKYDNCCYQFFDTLTGGNCTDLYCPPPFKNS